MFEFLKDKLKKAVGIFSREVEKESTVEKKEVLKEVKKPVVPTPVKKPVVNKPIQTNEIKKPVPVKEIKKPVKTEVKTNTIVADKIPRKVEKKELVKEKIQQAAENISKPNPKIEKKEIKEEVIKVQPKKQGFFQKLFGKKDEEEIIEEKEELRVKAESEILEPEEKEEETYDEKIEQEELSEEKHEEPIEEETEEESTKEEKMTDSSEDTEDETEIIEDNTAETNEEEETESETVTEEEQSDEELIEENKSVIAEEPVREKPKSFFTKITETFTKFHLSEEKFEELFFELEIAMLENNVAVEVIDKIKKDMRQELMSDKINRRGVEELILNRLKNSIIELFDVEKIDLISRIKNKKSKPYIITIIGVNCSGKTTSIAKLAHKFQKEGLSVVLAASDTFRAAAIQQLEEHANRLNVKMIKHDYNSDPAAVAFDAIKYAEAKNIDVVMIDTAGRLHSNTNLMRELEKVIRVCKPDIKIFVGESITGNDCVEQAKEFDKIAGIDAIILAKADVDDKGGAAISVSYVTGKPILYLGTGQSYDDLKEFDSEVIIKSLDL